jgi:dihydrofolate synthase/folylpolyglutamate synthase
VTSSSSEPARPGVALHLSYPAVQDYLFSLKAAGPKFGIDRMRRFAIELGSPERTRPVIHVAGTNGKGSVSAMLEAILRASGRRVGLYTSPHLVRLGERVQVDRQPLTESEIITFVAELQPVADRVAAVDPTERPSFFEFMTAMAFLQFARRNCDAAVVEVGLGGRLDATNIVDPAISVITSIGLDHTEMLGETIELIAAEKAGIIKPARPVVMGRVPQAAEQVIRARAQELGASLVSVREEFGEDLAGYPKTNLVGDYQRWNAATALLTAKTLGWSGLSQHALEALQHVDWPGRWQRLELANQTVILDASHNPEGVETLEKNLAALRAETGRAPVMVVGALGKTRAAALLAVVARYAREIRLIVPKQARSSSYEELEGLIPGGFSGPIRRDTVESIIPRAGECAVGAPDDPAVITGSIYLLGEILARLEPQRGAGESRLQDF